MLDTFMPFLFSGGHTPFHMTSCHVHGLYQYSLYIPTLSFPDPAIMGAGFWHLDRISCHDYGEACQIEGPILIHILQLLYE